MATDPIRGTDVFVLQRLSTYTKGSASSDIYTVTADQVGKFLEGKVVADLSSLQDQLDELGLALETVKTGIENTQVMIAKLNDRMITIERVVGDNVYRLNRVEEAVRDNLVRAKINFYHKLQDSVHLLPGEMSLFKNDTELAERFGQVRKIRYHQETEAGVINDFSLVFPDETIELTCFGNTQGILIDRAIYVIKGVPRSVINQDSIPAYYDVEVEISDYNGTVADLPYYQSAEDNPIRSDFYPISTKNQDSVIAMFDDYIEHTPASAESTHTGKLILKMPDGRRSKLTFEAKEGVDVVYKAILKFKDSTDYTLLSLGNDNHVVNLYGQLNMHDYKIYNLAYPVNPNDAATKKYIDEALEQFDITEEDLFKPGDQVAGTVASRAEVFGFYVESGNLYFKIGD